MTTALTPDPTTAAAPRRRGRPPGRTAPAAEPGLADSLSMTLREACRVTGISRDTMYDLIRAGEVRAWLMLTRRYVETASLRAYIERRAGEPISVRRGPNTREPAHPAAPPAAAKPGIPAPTRTGRGMACADRNAPTARKSTGYRR